MRIAATVLALAVLCACAPARTDAVRDDLCAEMAAFLAVDPSLDEIAGRDPASFALLSELATESTDPRGRAIGRRMAAAMSEQDADELHATATDLAAWCELPVVQEPAEAPAATPVVIVPGRRIPPGMLQFPDQQP